MPKPKSQPKEPHNRSPWKYYHISSTQLSIARYYGGIKVSGEHYLYDSTTDTLTREDVVRWEGKQKKLEKKQKEQNDANNSPELSLS